LRKSHITCIVSFLFFFTVFGQEKPNILWITIEDTSPQFIGCYGNKDARTPVIDQLAKEGVRFTNAFSTGTVCSPSRSTIITGVPTYKMGTGHHRSSFPIPNSIKGFPYFLKTQGYYTSNNVKTDYNLANEKEFIEEAWNESSKSAGWWNKKEDQPFFAVFNFNESHQSRTMSMSFDWYIKNVREHLPKEDIVADTAFAMPPIYRDSPEMRKQMARVYNAIALTDIRIGELLQKLKEDGLYDNTIIFLYADHGEGMPRGKTNGIDYGYRVPFIIRLPEKYEHLSPWGIDGAVTDELMNFEDLAPTVLSLAGVDIPEYLKGRAVLGKERSQPSNHLLLSADRADNGPDMVRTITDGRYVYSRNFMPFLPQMRYIRYIEISDIANQMRSDLADNLLDSLQKSLFEARPMEYLFDVKNDPWETNNLAEDKNFASVLQKKRKQLDEDLRNAKDVHFLPEYELGQISKTNTPYEFREDDGQYPFEEIYTAASLSGKRDAFTLKEQVQLLKGENPIVRYWAVTGLKSHPKENIKSFKMEIEAAMDDSYPPVAVLACAMAYDHFGNADAEQRLKQFCKSDNMHLALLALNSLLYFEQKQTFLETVKQVHQMPDRNYNVKAACMDYLGILGVVKNNAKNES